MNTSLSQEQLEQMATRFPDAPFESDAETIASYLNDARGRQYQLLRTLFERGEDAEITAELAALALCVTMLEHRRAELYAQNEGAATTIDN